jgi:nitroimidazol reductase NimA-like FMN-containing flavoprotein (pyridoxamine 5'-phosphate oxidase superfamily)
MTEDTMNDLTPTTRSRVKRLHERGAYDFGTIASILDAGLLCHVGYVVDGHPYVTPTAYWREGEHVYWHGSSASRMLRTLEKGVDACFTVSHLDGLVLARSGFNHSINYRSVMLFGRARKIEDEGAKLRALESFLERMFPGRWQQLRAATPQEIKATTVLGMAIEEGSAKVRTGWPHDNEDDYSWPVWAGVVPVHTVMRAPLPDERLADAITPPAYLNDLGHLGLRAK